MAWWTELLFFRGGIQFHNDDWLIPEENFTAKVRRVFHEYLKENFVDFLYYILSIFYKFSLNVLIYKFSFYPYPLLEIIGRIRQIGLIRRIL